MFGGGWCIFVIVSSGSKWDVNEENEPLPSWLLLQRAVDPLVPASPTRTGEEHVQCYSGANIEIKSEQSWAVTHRDVIALHL